MNNPQVGATFYPGGVDDFYMPQMMAPAPQRINNVAHLEQHAQRNNQRPTFSRFPVLKNRPPNVPPTPEDKEASLEAERLRVLRSTDTHIQLNWAQAALAYVDDVMRNERRTSNASLAAVNLSGVQQMLKEDAIKVTLFLADQGHPRALVLKGLWLDFGKFDYAVNNEEAWECYTTAVYNAKALSHHDPAAKWGGRALYRIGMQFENSKDIGKALKYYQKGVEAGDSAACYKLGMMVLLGQHGQTHDFQRGLDLIFASAQNADENAPQGAYGLGMLQVREIPQVQIPDGFLAMNIDEGRRNIERAALLGSAKAQLRMGSAYELCELGCDFNPVLSLHYNNLAARQGEPEAEMAISKWFLAGQEGVFETDEEMAFVYAQRAAQDRLSTAQFAMGYFHEVGIFVPVNLQVAQRWYEEAAANRNKDAAERIKGLSRSQTLSREYHKTVAVSKIKDSRFQSPPEPGFQAIDMPDHTRLSSPSIGSDPFLQQRSQSVAPYPGPNDFGLPDVPQSSNPEHRPNSAFGINPRLRPSSAATISSTQFSPGSQDQGWPNSVSGNPAQRHGRGGRVRSGPPQGRGALPQRGSTQPPPTAGIGYLAPLDNDTPVSDGKGPPPRSDSLHREKPVQVVSSKAPPNSRRRTPNPPLSPHAEYTLQEAGTEFQQGRSPGVAANQPSSAQRVPSPVKPAAATPPPGKGPKTFEEMGVPQVKGKGDCIVM